MRYKNHSTLGQLVTWLRDMHAEHYKTSDMPVRVFVSTQAGYLPVAGVKMEDHPQLGKILVLQETTEVEKEDDPYYHQF